MPKHFLTNYFGFNKQQRRGLFVLISISFLLLLLRIAYPHFIHPQTILIQQLPMIERQLDSSFENSKNQWSYKENSTSPTALFSFDPNSVSFDELLQLGFNKKSAHILLNFRNKGFVFKQKNDLKKVYGVSAPLFKSLEPYIVFQKSENTGSGNWQKKEKPESVISIKQVNKVELNSADSAALIAIKGIGASFAKRILKYRSLLGGYVQLDQLKEVYGFNEELYTQVKDNFTVNNTLVTKINLNTDAFKVINKHPYISYDLCKSIFDWRRKTSITALNLKDMLKDEVLYQKLLPYVSF